MFVIGAVMARHRAAVAVWIAARPSPFRVALLAAALLVMPIAFIEVPAMAYGKRLTRPAQPLGLTELAASKRPDDLSLSFTRRNTPPKP